eukprot:gene6806-13784_t
MDWGSYLARGVETHIYHMCDRNLFLASTEQSKLYYPPTYQSDGFIHATASANLLLDVANYFYKSAPGDWVCIELKPSRLGSPVIYESPAPVGNTASFDHVPQQKFPHIYGGIPRRAVVNLFPMERGNDGSFLSISSQSVHL